MTSDTPTVLKPSTNQTEEPRITRYRTESDRSTQPPRAFRRGFRTPRSVRQSIVIETSQCSGNLVLSSSTIGRVGTDSFSVYWPSTEQFEFVLLRQLRHPLVPSEGRIVLGREGAHPFELRGTLREQFSRFGEEFFEPRWGNDFHQTGHFVGRIPERVRDSAWLPDVIPRTRQENLVADSSAELTLHDVGILIRVMVEVRWDESPRLDVMLHDGKRSVGFVAGDLELDPDSTYRNKLAFLGRNRESAMVLLSRIHSHHRTRASSNPVNKFLCAGRRRHELKARNIAEQGSAPARSPWLTDIPRPRNRSRVDPIRSPLSKLIRMIVSRSDIQSVMHLLNTSGVFQGQSGDGQFLPTPG